MSTSLSIHLKRASKIYHEGETLSGVVRVEGGPGGCRHEGLQLRLEGGAALPVRNPSLLLDALQPGTKHITLIQVNVELAPAGKIPSGVTDIPFEIPLQSKQATSLGYHGLLETYHGVFVNVIYVLKCHMRRSFLNKPVNATCQFFIQYKQKESPPVKPVRCEMSPSSVGAGAGRTAGRVSVPSFRILAELHSTVCSLDKPLTGQVSVKECGVGIKSIELQLVRVETCAGADGPSRDATEIQNVQVGDGDVCRGVSLPLYMVLPRLFTCPTTTTPHFNIEFELNIAVIFEDAYLVTENFPILLVR